MSGPVDGGPGLYGPGSITWRLSRERVLLVGGPRALLMQVAHPLVAAGVADFSSFRTDPVARLRRTLDSTLGMIFGDDAGSRRSTARINAVHGQVHGTLPQAAGRFPAGTPYDATDPELLLWVHATLVDSTFATYTRFVGALESHELEAAYEESKVAALALGVPSDLVPPDLAAFEAYVDGMLASGALAAAPFQREIAHDVLYPPLRPPLRRVPRRLHWPTVAITASLLPPRIRQLFGVELTPARSRMAEAARLGIRGVLPWLPRVVRVMPQARRATRRARAA